MKVSVALPQKNGRASVVMSIFLFRSSDRACFGTRSALDAGIRVDFVLAVALLNTTNRAFFRASTAGNAVITYLVRHKCLLSRPHSRLSL